MTADDVESLRAAFQATRGCRYYILQVDGLVHATHVGYNTGNDGITITRVRLRCSNTYLLYKIDHRHYFSIF